MLEVEALEVNIGTANILREVNLSVKEGTMCGLIGRNGAGKTTFIRSVMGLFAVRAGKITFEGQDLLKVQAHRRAHLGIGYMPEDRGLVPDFTSEANLFLPAWATGMTDAAQRLRWVYKLMPEVEQFASRRANQLSGGQQKMTALARALMAGKRLRSASMTSGSALSPMASSFFTKSWIAEPSEAATACSRLSSNRPAC